MGDAAVGNLAPPKRYVVPKPSGDPDAARHLAAAYDGCAEALVAQVRQVAAVLTGLGSAWQGAGARAARTPEQVLTEDVARIAHALRRSADDLRHYAHQLDRAHEHHGWSIGRLVTLGAVVTVGVAAVVVTVGAAAPAEAAAAAAAVETAEAATTAAGAAGTTAATSLSSWQALLAGVRPLAPFVVPHLVSAGASVGLDGISQLLGTHRLDMRSLELAAAVGFAGSATGGAVEGALSGTRPIVRRLAEGGTWTVNGTAGGYADTGEVDPLDSLSFGLTGLVARDVRFGVDETRLMWKLRVPQLPLGFDGGREWRRFVTTMYDGLDKAGYRDAVVAFRGSSITGCNFKYGHAFDALYRSDWDLAVIHEGGMTRARGVGVAMWNAGRRTPPLGADQLARLGLSDVAFTLEGLAGRDVQWMLYKNLDAVQRRAEPFLIVPRP
jgi:uncharacterized protein YukE